MGLAGLLLIGATVIPGELREEYHVDFRGQSLPPGLRPVLPKSSEWIRSDWEGLRVRLPANRSILAPLGLTTTFALCGDFEITAAYQVLAAEVPKAGYGVGVSLRIKKGDPSSEAAAVAWVVRPGGREVASWTRALEDREGKVRFTGGVRVMSVRNGRLRLQRAGKTLSFLLAEGITGEDFRRIHQCDFGAEDLEQVVLQVVTNDQPCAIDARWLDFQVRAEGVASMAQPPGSRKAFWWAVAVTGTIGLSGGIAGWRRWRQQQKCLKKKPMSSARQPGQ